MAKRAAEPTSATKKARVDDALPKVFPSQAFRLRWLVDLNGTWRGVESMLHVGEKGVRLTQVVLTTPGANGKIGGVEHKQIGAWQYGDVLEWGASDTHLLLACKSSKVPKGKDYILETSQAEAIVSSCCARSVIRIHSVCSTAPSPSIAASGSIRANTS